MKNKLCSKELILTFSGTLIALIISVAIISVMNVIDYKKKVGLLTILLCVINLLPIIIMWYKQKIDFFSPLFITLLTFFVFFPLRAGYIIWKNDYQFINTIGANQFLMDRVILIIIFGMGFLYIGYFFPFYKMLEKMFKNISPLKKIINIKLEINEIKKMNYFSNFLMVLALIGFLVFGLSQGSFNIGRGGTKLAGENAYIYLSINLLIPSLLIKYICIKEAKKSSLFFYILLFFTIYLYMVLGGRYRLIMLLISLAFFQFYYHKIRFGRTISLFAGFIFIYMISVLGSNRNSLYFGSSINLTTGIDTIQTNFLSSKGDLNILDTFIKVYEGIPTQLPYEYGITFLSILVQPIPRTIFPAKPEYASKIIMESLMPEYYEKGIGFASSILGDFMLNFGILGILIGMLFIGILLRTISRFKYKNIQGKLIFAISLSIIPFYIRGEFVGTTVWYLVVLIPALIPFYYFAKRRKYKI
ncbi:hypothetical protein CN383_16220 [Priestia megaterium]|uniref:O-antigen polymerase n=1 Tax=Priestia megaterium TaxID=1404 RepID=UPI000BF34035|nr:O-antigen polymerase [Priestia megaterium]PFA99196.1 hypothetical protein CN383_16220 [Priestia megaterium]